MVGISTAAKAAVDIPKHRMDAVTSPYNIRMVRIGGNRNLKIRPQLMTFLELYGPFGFSARDSCDF